MAHAAARLDAPMVANVVEFHGDELVRVRWGGSLLERCSLIAPIRLLTVAHHAFAAEPAPVDATVRTLDVDLHPSLGRTLVRSRVAPAAGLTLGTSPVVVGGGRGVGSPEGFAPLEELAASLERAGLVVTSLRDHTRDHHMTAQALACAFAGDAERIAAQIGRRALEELLAAQPEEIAEEIVRINTESRPRALQAALLVPLLAAVIGFVNGFRMMKLPDVKPSADIEGMTLGG